MEGVIPVLVQIVELVMGDKAGECPDILIRQMNIFDPACLKLAISKGALTPRVIPRPLLAVSPTPRLFDVALHLPQARPFGVRGAGAAANFAAAALAGGCSDDHVERVKCRPGGERREGSLGLCC